MRKLDLDGPKIFLEERNGVSLKQFTVIFKLYQQKESTQSQKLFKESASAITH